LRIPPRDLRTARSVPSAARAGATGTRRKGDPRCGASRRVAAPGAPRSFSSPAARVPRVTVLRCRPPSPNGPWLSAWAKALSPARATSVAGGPSRCSM
jgi:hypothetical protein